jgi:hypothetical protein
MTALQLSFKLQIKQGKKYKLDIDSLRATRKDNSKNCQNTTNSYKSINLRDVKNPNYDLTAKKHIKDSNLTKNPNNLKEEIKEQIKELKKLMGEEEKLSKLVLETFDEIVLENTKK